MTERPAVPAAARLDLLIASVVESAHWQGIATANRVSAEEQWWTDDLEKRLAALRSYITERAPEAERAAFVAGAEWHACTFWEGRREGAATAEAERRYPAGAAAEWQDENRTYTEEERARDQRLDCLRGAASVRAPDGWVLMYRGTGQVVKDSAGHLHTEQSARMSQRSAPDLYEAVPVYFGASAAQPSPLSPELRELRIAQARAIAREVLAAEEAQPSPETGAQPQERTEP